MSFHVSRWARASVLGIAALFVVTACSSSSSSPAASSGGGSTPAASGAAATGATGSSPTIDRIKKAGVMRVGYASALPWLGQDTKTNEWFGPNDLLGRKLAEKLGVKLEPVTQTFDQLVPAVQAGTIDVALSPMFITEKRLAAIDMTGWTEAGTCYLIRKDETRFKTPADINQDGIRVSGFIGTGTTQQIQKAYPKAKMVIRQQAPGEEVDYLPIQQGQADLAPFDSPLAVVYADKFKDTLKVFPDAQTCIKTPDLPTDIGVGFTKGDTGFKQVLDDLIKEIQPQLDAEIAKYSDPQYLAPAK